MKNWPGPFMVRERAGPKHFGRGDDEQSAREVCDRLFRVRVRLRHVADDGPDDVAVRARPAVSPASYPRYFFFAFGFTFGFVFIFAFGFVFAFDPTFFDADGFMTCASTAASEWRCASQASVRELMKAL